MAKFFIRTIIFKKIQDYGIIWFSSDFVNRIVDEIILYFVKVLRINIAVIILFYIPIKIN